VVKSLDHRSRRTATMFWMYHAARSPSSKAQLAAPARLVTPSFGAQFRLSQAQSDVIHGNKNNRNKTAFIQIYLFERIVTF